MALTGAERQAAYRKSRPFAGENGERRINTWVSTEASLALFRLARNFDLSQRQILEQLLIEAQEKVLAGLEHPSPEWDTYFKLRRKKSVARRKPQA